MLQLQYLNGAMGVKRLLEMGKLGFFPQPATVDFCGMCEINFKSWKIYQKMTGLGYVFWVVVSYCLCTALSYIKETWVNIVIEYCTLLILEGSVLISQGIRWDISWIFVIEFSKSQSTTQRSVYGLEQLYGSLRRIKRCLDMCCVAMLTAGKLCFVLGLRLIWT